MMDKPTVRSQEEYHDLFGNDDKVECDGTGVMEYVDVKVYRMAKKEDLEKWKKWVSSAKGKKTR